MLDAWRLRVGVPTQRQNAYVGARLIRPRDEMSTGFDQVFTIESVRELLELNDCSGLYLWCSLNFYFSSLELHR